MLCDRIENRSIEGGAVRNQMIKKLYEAKISDRGVKNRCCEGIFVREMLAWQLSLVRTKKATRVTG
jgi:hypothetical protein